MQTQATMLDSAQSSPNIYECNANVHPSTQIANIKDLTKIQVNTAHPVQERLKRFIADVGNPYLFRVGDTVVHVRYSSQSITLQESLTYLASK